MLDTTLQPPRLGRRARSRGSNPHRSAVERRLQSGDDPLYVAAIAIGGERFLRFKSGGFRVVTASCGFCAFARLVVRSATVAVAMGHIWKLLVLFGFCHRSSVEFKQALCLG